MINATTAANLDSSNRVVTLKYIVTIGGQTLASIALTRVESQSTPPSASLFTPPSSCGNASDPFDPRSCTGDNLNLGSKFAPGTSSYSWMTDIIGAKAAALANYTLTYGKRDCTQFTGCGEWGPVTPSWGPSGKGTIWLKVTNTGIVATLVDHNAGSSSGTPIYNLGADCSFSSNVWSCGQYRDTEIREGINFLRFESSGKFGGVSPSLVGSILTSCARFSGSAKGTTSNGAWAEYRVGLLAQF